MVIDTNILIDAWKDDFSYAMRIIKEVKEGNIAAVASHKIWREYQLILDKLVNNPEHYQFMNNFFCLIDIVEPRVRLNVVKYDREDNKFFECALTAQAEFIVTNDIHLIEVGEYQGIRAVKPEDFWAEYKKDESNNEWQSWMKSIIK